MALGKNKRAVGLFASRHDAEQALQELKNSGFSMDKVSVIARNADKDDQIAGADVRKDVGNQADEGAKAGAVAGGTLGGFTGLLVGLGTLAIPGIGPIMLAGATATALATTLSGAAIGAAAGSLLGALIGLGIPEERARVYNERVSHGDYLVIVDGTDEEISRAEAILKRRGIQEFGVYDAADVTNARSDDSGVGRYTTIEAAAASAHSTAATLPPQASAPLGRHKRAIGVFPHRRDAEAALTELRDSGFPMDRVSVIAKHADGEAPLAGADVSDRVGTKAGNKADEGAKAGAVGGGALGGLTGLLVGLGTVAIPGVGPVLLGGAAATALATTLAGGAIGAAAGGLGGALVGLGIPEERAKVYNDRVARGDYLVIVDGRDEEIARAEAILNSRGIQDFGIYDTDGVDTARTDSNYVAPKTTLGVDTTRTQEQVISTHPEVVIIDRRDQTP